MLFFRTRFTCVVRSERYTRKRFWAAQKLAQCNQMMQNNVLTAAIQILLRARCAGFFGPLPSRFQQASLSLYVCVLVLFAVCSTF